MSRAFCVAAALTWAGFFAAGRLAAAPPASGAPAPGAPQAGPSAPESKDVPPESAKDLPPASANSDAAEQEKLEKAFAEAMTGATLCGHFTAGSMADAPCKDSSPAGDAEKGPDAKPAARSSEPAKPLKEDRYTLGRVQKLQGDNWLIEARIQYGGHDVTVPLMLKIKWAGDTPVITLTDFSVPGLGVFTSRVLFYRGQYAGTWRHGDHGGELFGKVLPAKSK